MKTFDVLFVDEPVVDLKVALAMKKYCFNSEDDIKVGDIIKCPAYKRNLQVIEELPKSYLYFNFVSGILKNKIDHPKDAAIKELKLGPAPDIAAAFVVYGERIANVSLES